MTRRHTGVLGLLAAVPLLLAGTSAALAQAKPADGAPVRTETVVYENWIVTCRDRVEKSSKKICAATLKVSDTKSKRDVLVWQIGQDDAGAPTFAFRVPFGVRVKEGVSVVVDSGKPRKVDYVTCDNRGCEAAGPLDAAFGKELLGGRQATVTFTLINGRPVSLKVPLNGIAKALPALKG